MKTAEEVMMDQVDMLIGNLKVRVEVESVPKAIEACIVSLTLCETTRSTLWGHIDSEEKRMDRVLNKVLNESISQIRFFRDNSNAGYEGKEVYSDIDNALMYIRDHYYEMKKGEKVCKSILVLQRI